MIVAAESFTLEYAFEIDRTETLPLNEVVGVYFARDQVAAMTNQLCVQTFLDNGLPPD